MVPGQLTPGPSDPIFGQVTITGPILPHGAPSAAVFF